MADHITKVADAMRRAFFESRTDGGTPLPWHLLKVSEQDQWLETAHIFHRICGEVGVDVSSGLTL